MARQHGKDTRVYLGARDASGDIAEISTKATVATHDSTVLGLDAFRFDPGLFGWEGSLTAFYQPGAGNIGPQLETLLGSQTGALGVLSLYDADAAAVGAVGTLAGEGVFHERGTPISVADLIKVNASIRGNGRLGQQGVLLHPLAARATSGNGSSVDNAASSANGGRGNLHVTAVTGSGTVKIQHSTDNASWSDLITFTATAAVTSESIEVTGTVNRYLRATWAPGTSITFVAGFARY